MILYIEEVGALLTASAHSLHSRNELPSVESARRCSHMLLASLHLCDTKPPTCTQHTIHTHTHAHTHTHIHAHKCTSTHAGTRARTHITHTHTHTRMRVHVYTRTHASMYVFHIIDACMHTSHIPHAYPPPPSPPNTHRRIRDQEHHEAR
jgi:hypothetical protein